MIRRTFRIFPFAAMLASLSIGSAAAAALTPAQQRDVLIEAQQSYDRGIAQLRSNPTEAGTAFQSAADRFQLVIESGVVNGRLYLNLANAELQAGDLGGAIADYRRAERLIPGDDRLRANLEYARSLCRNRIAPSGRQALLDVLLLWHHRTSAHARGAAFIAAYLCFWLIVLARMLRRGGAWIILTIVSGVIWMALGVSLFADISSFGRAPAGVVIHDDVIVRKGNGAGYAQQFEQPLSTGVEFDVLEQRGDWVNIRLANGGEGWIEARSAELIDPHSLAGSAHFGALP
jgi:hypothetical protein